jgi:hypothetical protein
MANRENERQPNDEMSPIEQSLVLLLRAVLTADEQELLAAFNFITKPTVRHALIALANAATTTELTGVYRDRDEEHLDAVSNPLFSSSSEISLRRVRQALRLRVGKPGERHESR